MQVLQQIDGFTRHADEAVRPPISQEMIKLSHRGGNVAPSPLIGDGERLAGLDVVEPQRANIDVGPNSGRYLAHRNRGLSTQTITRSGRGRHLEIERGRPRPTARRRRAAPTKVTPSAHSISLSQSTSTSGRSGQCLAGGHCSQSSRNGSLALRPFSARPRRSERLGESGWQHWRSPRWAD